MRIEFDVDSAPFWMTTLISFSVVFVLGLAAIGFAWLAGWVS